MSIAVHIQSRNALGMVRAQAMSLKRHLRNASRTIAWGGFMRALRIGYPMGSGTDRDEEENGSILIREQVVSPGPGWAHFQS